jgi:hypothetical protein
LIHALHFAERSQACSGLKVRVRIAARPIKMLHAAERIVAGTFFGGVYIRRVLREGERAQE